MKARKVKGLEPTTPLSENAARIVDVRLRELRSLAPAALEEGADEAQHDLRIAAKRLRYVLEATGFCFGRPANAALKRAKELQDVLGEINDANVMLPRLADHRRQMRADDAELVRARAGDAPDLEPVLAGRAQHRTAYRGLEVLDVYLLARRALLFERFTELWASIEKRGSWDALRKTTAKELERAEARRLARERADRAREELTEAERIRSDASQRAQRAAQELAEAERQRRA